MPRERQADPAEGSSTKCTFDDLYLTANSARWRFCRGSIGLTRARGIAYAEKKVRATLLRSNRFRVELPRYVVLSLRGRLTLDQFGPARVGLE